MVFKYIFIDKSTLDVDLFFIQAHNIVVFLEGLCYHYSIKMALLCK